MDAPTDASSALGPARALIIPMHNEVARIGRTLEELAASPLAVGDLEVVLVDDGSDDGTPAAALAAAQAVGLRARLVELGRNQGKGAAVRTGMLASSARTRVFVDADLCVELKDLLRCFEVLESGEADVAYGTRAHPESLLPRTQPVHRVLSGRAYNFLLRHLGLTAERDTQCGMKGFSASAAEAIFGVVTTPGFGFDVEVLARAARGGWRVRPVPVTWSHVDASRVRPLRDGISMGGSALVIARTLRSEERYARPGGRAGPMAVEAIDAMARVERDHWWFRAKRDLVADQLARHAVGGRILDVGCGTGGLLRELGRDREVVGIEPDPAAVVLAAGAVRGARSARIVRGGAADLPVRSAWADAVTALDVIEHLDDDVAALRELARVAGDGLLLIAVPAYTWAWSEHDVRLGHRRRYSRRSLETAAAAAGLDVLRSTHFHSWLAPVALLLRRTPLRRLLGDGAEEASFVHPVVNAVLHLVTQVERRVLRHVDLPVGLSILLVARRPGPPPLR